MVGKGDSPDREIAAIAREQHGIVTARQLLEVGLSDTAISKRAARGRLHRLHRGVYAVGHLGLSQEARWMAAVLACGEGAVLSHFAAAALWGMMQPREGRIDVSVPTQAGRRQRPGIRIHRCQTLAQVIEAPSRTAGLEKRQPRPVAVRNRIPVTAPLRTVDDLRRSAPPHLVRRAIRQAEYLGLPLDGLVTDGTRSDFEGDLLRLCQRHRLPPPEVNAPVGRWTVDFLWREQRVAVETDSYRTHRGSIAFEDDHLRDLQLRRAGFTVHRFTERQVRTEAAVVAADLARALRRPRAAPVL